LNDDDIVPGLWFGLRLDLNRRRCFFHLMFEHENGVICSGDLPGGRFVDQLRRIADKKTATRDRLDVDDDGATCTFRLFVRGRQKAREQCGRRPQDNLASNRERSS
jgi:hypothetical protein